MDGTEFLDVTITIEDDKEDTNVVKAYDIKITSRNLWGRQSWRDSNSKACEHENVEFIVTNVKMFWRIFK